MIEKNKTKKNWEQPSVTVLKFKKTYGGDDPNTAETTISGATNVGS